MLRRFRFQFTGCADIGHQRQVDIDHVLLAGICLELPDGLQKRKAFDVADGAADFNNDNIHTGCRQLNAILYLVGNVRNHLNGSPEVVTPPFFGYNCVIYFPGGKITILAQFGPGKPFIVPEIKICFGTIVGNKHLTVLKRIHGTRIHVEIGIQFLNCHRKSPAFQQGTDCRRGKTFS